MRTTDQEREIGEVLSHYFSETGWQLRIAGELGQNNTTRFVDTAAGTFVMRIYENENTLPVVQFEHELLERLSEQPLPFQTPRLIPTKSGSTYARTGSGKYGALFALIDGEHPSKQNEAHVRAIGSAIAQLSLAMQTLELTGTSAYAGYAEIYKIHPLVTRDALTAFFSDPGVGFDPVLADEFLRALRSCERSIEQLPLLPQQLIHGDVTVGNTLLIGNRVSGILDFEFAAWDYRAMEMAVFFVGLIGDEEADWTRMEAFLAGYGGVLKWSREEIAALPLFLNLRKFTNSLHLIGRMMAGHNDLSAVTNKLEESFRTEDWLAQNKERLFRLCEIYLLP